ncbi:MAG: nodulation protein NfeD, partial [Gammaproteobacteria bacterium]|nr:nodulation protein NfeD [Gammaproteobacteria bacterium]
MAITWCSFVQIKSWRGLLLAFCLGFSSGLHANNAVWQLDLVGAIGPASSDYVLRGLEQAQQQNAPFVILRIDTPGGLDLAMRDIIQAILASRIPVACYVAPAGARAASAGTYILYACHFAAMAPATNLGAATPVQIATPSLPGLPGKGKAPQSPAPGAAEPGSTQQRQATGNGDDSVSADEPAITGTAMEKKIINDAIAYIEGLARLRNRNVDWAIKAVRDGASLNAEEALELGVIDALANNIGELLEVLDKREFIIHEKAITLDTSTVKVVLHEPDWRNEFLATITNPNVAYILMMIGVYGLFFEFSNPGMGVPGIAGALCLLLAMYAFQVLPVSYTGVALLVLGIALIIAEALSPSFGVLGLGGTISFVIGSIILMDTELPGYRIALPIIAAVAVFSLALVFLIARLMVKTRRNEILGDLSHLINTNGSIETMHNGQAMARFDG